MIAIRVAECHRLHLVVRDVDHCRAEPPVQELELAPQFRAQPGVEVRQRFIEQKHLGLRTSARPIATRWRWPPDSSAGLRASSVSRCSSSAVRRTRAAISSRPTPRTRKTERQISGDGHRRVERVRLEHHADFAVGSGPRP